jgi:hypothetical protein
VKRKVIRSAILLLCLVSPFIIWRLWLRFSVSRQLAAIRVEGLPTDARELDAWYRAVPANQNAALILTQAFSLCERNIGDKIISSFKLPPRGQKLHPGQVDLLRAKIAADDKALARADEALRLSESRYPLDFSLGYNTPLPHLAPLRRFALCRQIDAALRVEAGEFAKASADIESILGFAGTLNNEPCLISQLVRQQLMKISVQTLELRIGSAPLNDLELTNLIAAFKQIPEPTSRLTTALIGERAMVATLFSMSQADTLRMLEPAKDKETEQAFPRHRTLALRIAGFYDLDERYFLSAMDRAIESIAESRNARAANDLIEAGGKAVERYYTASSTLSSFASSIPRQVEGDAQIRLALATLQVETFRNHNGGLPERFEQLQEQSRFEWPNDPFDGRPLRYLRRGRGYVVYSVGRDWQDDLGREPPESKRDASKQGFDITFTVDR